MIFNRFNKIKHINTIITFWMSIFALISMIIVAGLIYFRFDNELKSSYTTNSIQVVDQVKNALDSYITNTLNFSDKIVSDMTTFLQSDRSLIINTLNTAYRLREDIVSITVFDNKGEISVHAPSTLIKKNNISIPHQDWYQNAKQNKEKYSFSYPRVQNLYNGRYDWIITISRKIDIDNKDISTGSILAMDINFSYIEQECRDISIGKRGYVFLLDQNNNIIYHPQQQMIYSGIKSENIDFISDKPDGEYIYNNNNNVYVIREIEHTGWKLVGVNYFDELLITRYEISVFLIMFFIFAILIVLIFSMTISRKIAAPIVNLTNAIDNTKDGIEEFHTKEKSYYEVEKLSSSFNEMINRINLLLEQIKKEQSELRKTELRALQSQINPHFLYNTLGSIVWMCEQNESKQAVEMVEALADLFRISISKGNEIITIRDEITHVKSYLKIQKTRYKEQFDYTIDVDDEFLDCVCLKILLQPFVENSIYHGINRMVDKGKISISIKRKDDNILLIVADNGVGIDEQVFKDISNIESNNNYGIGIKNVHDRVKIYFGEEYGVNIKSNLDIGTIVEILIPYKRRDSFEDKKS